MKAILLKQIVLHFSLIGKRRLSFQAPYRGQSKPPLEVVVAVTSSGRELLERVFSCNVYDQYASSEGAPFVAECGSQVLHIELTSGVFEHFEEGSDAVLVTSFTTH